ncbi:MAG: hypothetical protein ABIT64_02900 [Lysobacteraceae bacterium]
MNDHNDIDETSEPASEQWWLATVGNLLVWARLRVRSSGIAEIFDCDGRIDTHDSEDTARAALMDAEYHAFDGLDDDDAAQMGFDLDEIEPPHVGSDDDDALRALMTRRLPSLH